MNVTRSGKIPLGAGLLCLILAVSSRSETGDMQLPDLTTMGKSGPHSRFAQFRDRSRSILDFKPKARLRDSNLAVLFAGEQMVAGATVWMYPDGSGYPMPSMTDAQAKHGRYSLEVVLKPDSYSGGAVCSPSPIDLASYLNTGVLELWVKGAQGHEVFSIGLLDNGNNAVGRPLQVWVNSRSYGEISKDEWKQFRIPLKAFGVRGSYWSDDVGARIYNTLNWSAISCFSFDIDKDLFKSFKVWMDDVEILKVGPKNSAAVGIPYPMSNEDFNDFPATDSAGASK